MIFLTNINYRNSGKSKVYYLGAGRSFNISNLVGPKNIGKYGISNFIVAWTSPSGSAGITAEETDKEYKMAISATVTTTSDFILSYNNSTGVLTISGGTYTVSAHQPAYDIIQTSTYNNNPKVYFVPNIELISNP